MLIVGGTCSRKREVDDVDEDEYYTILSKINTTCEPSEIHVIVSDCKRTVDGRI